LGDVGYLGGLGLGLDVRRGRLVVGGLTVCRQLLTQRHPMAATGGLGVGRLFSVRRRFSVGGQIT
jgi:hypothetical protein